MSAHKASFQHSCSKVGLHGGVTTCHTSIRHGAAAATTEQPPFFRGTILPRAVEFLALSVKTLYIIVLGNIGGVSKFDVAQILYVFYGSLPHFNWRPFPHRCQKGVTLGTLLLKLDMLEF